MACPAMLPNTSDDGLFLLEVLIDKIRFAKNFNYDQKYKISVVVQCVFVDPFEIGADESECNAFWTDDGSHVVALNIGKSCLFSLKEYDIFTAMRKFPIKITVYITLPSGFPPHRFVVGEATIDMTKEFVQTRNKHKEDPNNVSYQALKDSFCIVGAEGVEAGEVSMFLRISCFGKLIVTRFQGFACPPPSNPGSRVSRDCAALGTCTSRDLQIYQITETAPSPQQGNRLKGQPCTTEGHAPGGICPPARDPYNSKPCEEPDDPCYCTGPKKPQKTKLACRNTDPYCLHIPKGNLPSLLLYHELTEENTQEIGNTSTETMQRHIDEFSHAIPDWSSKKQVFSNSLLLNQEGRGSNTTNISGNVTNFYSHLNERKNLALFSQNETCVYMTLCTADNHRRNSETQATATINKCLQVHGDTLKSITFIPSNMGVDTGFNYWNFTSATTENYNLMSLEPSSVGDDIPLYFLGLGKKKLKLKSSVSTESEAKTPWPQKSEFNTQMHRNKQKETDRHPLNVFLNRSIINQNQSIYQNQATEMSENPCVNPFKTEIWCQTGSCKPRTCTDLVATVSHVKIKPPKVCSVHDKDPCNVFKSCINYPPNDDDKAPVIVTTGANPRRGVFEVVIRRLNGAPLAKNELTLEWTPPSSRPCGAPCPLPCFFPNTCRPTKCKTIVCRAPPCKPFKCCMKICKRPCGPIPRPCGLRPCGPVPCGSMPCGPMPCGITCPKKFYPPPCRPSTPRLCLPACQSAPPLLCPSLPCPSRPCPPRPCRLPQPCLSPCSSPCYGRPCQSSPCCEYLWPSIPCFRPCPVGKCRKWKKNRKQKIKKHRKHISPCLNRAEYCPVVSCRNMSPGCGTCASCLPCSTAKCCSPCKSVKFPFKPRCCRSECANCC
ncbi:uncharacterized protein LOC113226298 isoform X2 [Hyposmocoma kahamanoa]|uniref:uncharacterized protein LOC113226298 isoform X2 n=1 Tax=Hyposmocoma kahamanoa TaxID=1477025 RepID=UPI000E6D61D7|nr:uncharacterized protein LOC113226298 isoform X2 [Hyposmocoma kahamanoa]